MEKKINKKILLGIFFGACVYLISKNKLYFSWDNLKYFFESATRRIFITQGSGFIARLELLNLGFDFTNRDIKKEVFKYIYKVEGGSSPTYFLGSLIIQTGYILALLIHFIILMFLFCFSRLITNNKNSDNFKFWCWEIFSFYYIILNSDINLTNSFRIIAIILNLIVIKTLSKNQKYEFEERNL